MIRHLRHAATGVILFLAVAWGLTRPIGKDVLKAANGKTIVGGIFACLAVIVIASLVLAWRARKAAPAHTSPYSFLTSRKGR